MQGFLSAVFAADRALRMVPSLVQVWFVEFFFIVPLGLFCAKLLDNRGVFGCPGENAGIGGVFWGALALSLASGFFFAKNLLFPKARIVEWTPAFSTGIGVGGVALGVAPARWSVRYPFLTSHPSHALLLLVTLWLPLTLWLATRYEGCGSLYWKAFGAAGMAIVAAMAVARFLAFYVFRRGVDLLQGLGVVKGGFTPARLGWEIGWKPVVTLVVLMYAFAWIPLGALFWAQARRISNLPLVTVAMAPLARPPAETLDAAGQIYVRVEGRVKGEPVFRPVKTGNRGGDNYLSAAVLVALDGGGEALRVAMGSWVPELRRTLAGAR